ncbi:MAG: FMN-binding negative transcriptional regulator [Agarilytica sp.]
MYIPKPFEVTSKNEICAFIEANAFGQLISTVSGRLFSTHIPFLLSEDKTRLIAHLAKPNPQHNELEGQEVLVTLEGPHDYISPSWYEGAGVPTWNYQAVHIYGVVNVFTDVDRLKGVVDELTKKYESDFERPWQAEYNAAMLNVIVGVEIEISDIQCKYKLSQNRSGQDRLQVVEQLELQGAVALANAMKSSLLC